MKVYINPERKLWYEILKRPIINVNDLYPKVQAVLDDIKADGDSALVKYTKQFDGIDQSIFKVPEIELHNAANLINASLREAIGKAAENITRFHSSQKTGINKIEVSPGVVCWQKPVAIEKVGLYIPGGSAPLFSTVLMLAIPAKIAGCHKIVLCTPPGKSGIHPAILYAAQLAGVDQVYALGGIQAIGAMAIGTETIPRVDKIFGPGNQYVTAAKQLVSMNDVAIDMPAGPSEVMVVADETSVPAFVASDLLSQAEHGPDSQVILLANNMITVDKIKKEINLQLQKLSRKNIASKALSNSISVVLENKNDQIDMINAYAPEHLILCNKDYKLLSEKVLNAGSVFLGNYTPESAGDYASGTNHTLPTNGWARSYSGVNLDSFIRKITFQEITREGLNLLGPAIEAMATAEMLDAHKNAVTLRLLHNDDN